jgi:hypothetical protein
MKNFNHNVGMLTRKHTIHDILPNAMSHYRHEHHALDQKVDDSYK